MSSIIEVSNLSKSYTITHESKEKFDTLRDLLTVKAKNIFYSKKVNVKNNIPTKEEFWALKDVNFKVEQGDRVGIIGRNGAGKSTLLKILSHITDPTTGKIKIKGRVASLLEVGTGFHPELSGRENIFLNGAILGMNRNEIRKHFDAIVEFAEIEKFLDTPVKRYSSGMYVRLAFAVAAHLEPEILIVDEVLAVGDAQFQKKCLGKMEDVSKGEGRTVLFVSHNIHAIKKLCNSGVFLSEGKVAFKGNINDSIDSYYKTYDLNTFEGIIPPNISTYKAGYASFVKINILNEGGIIYFNQNLDIKCEIFCEKEVYNVFLDLRVNSLEFSEISHSTNAYESLKPGIDLKKGINYVKIEIENNFQPGNYTLSLGIHELNGTTLNFVENISPFEILSISKDSKDFIFPAHWALGKIRVKSKWEINE